MFINDVIHKKSYLFQNKSFVFYRSLLEQHIFAVTKILTWMKVCL